MKFLRWWTGRRPSSLAPAVLRPDTPRAERPLERRSRALRKTGERLQAALDVLVRVPKEACVAPLSQLVDAIRSGSARRTGAGATKRLQLLIEILHAQEDSRLALRDAVIWLIADTKTVHLYADTGILGSEGFFTALSKRLSHKLLPEEIDATRLKDLLGLIFRHPQDYRWVDSIADACWLELFAVVDFSSLTYSDAAKRIRLQLLHALEVLSYRITALGLEPEIVRVHPEIERFESPFLAQNFEVRQLIEEWNRALLEQNGAHVDYGHLLVMLDQASEIINRTNRQTEKIGASIKMTHLLVRLQQNLGRIGEVLALLQEKPLAEHERDVLRLMRELIAGENRKNSLRDMFSQNVSLLAYRITSNAGRVGEAYMIANRREYSLLLLSAMGAGCLAAIMAAIKIRLGHEQHAPLVQAILFSANYSIGFMLMHVLHLSLATKQPAMTANRLAHSMDLSGPRGVQLDGLAELVVRTLRGQFVAVLGNISVAVPIALSLARLLSSDGEPYPDRSHAQSLLAQCDPLSVITWMQAAWTGVALFLAGLIAGYYENRALYARVPQRLMQLAWLRRLLGERGARAVSDYIGVHLGGLAGNFFFGIILGSSSAVGRVVGLPIDVLHVTFVSANDTYAAMSLWPQGFDQLRVIRLMLGVALIGTLNLSVSFGIALFVAMRSRQVRFKQAWPLLKRVGGRFVESPWQFFLPPRDRALPPD